MKNIDVKIIVREKLSLKGKNSYTFKLALVILYQEDLGIERRHWPRLLLKSEEFLALLSVYLDAELTSIFKQMYPHTSGLNIIDLL